MRDTGMDDQRGAGPFPWTVRSALHLRQKRPLRHTRRTAPVVEMKAYSASSSWVIAMISQGGKYSSHGSTERSARTDFLFWYTKSTSRSFGLLSRKAEPNNHTSTPDIAAAASVKRSRCGQRPIKSTCAPCRPVHLEIVLMGRQPALLRPSNQLRVHGSWD